MKKLTVLIAACLLSALAGCKSENAAGNAVNANQSRDAVTDSASYADTSQNTENVVEIKEKLFIAGINDIYLNQDDYLGKTIKYEGMFTSYTWAEKGITYYLVYRNSPGCCGADGQAGFEVLWSDEANKTYPNENDWVEAVGTLESYDEDGYAYLRLRLDSLTVKTERGAEFVSQ